MGSAELAVFHTVTTRAPGALPYWVLEMVIMHSWLDGYLTLLASTIKFIRIHRSG